jgi:hypothetical protein
VRWLRAWLLRRIWHRRMLTNDRVRHCRECLALPCCHWTGALLHLSAPEIPGKSSPALGISGVLHASDTLDHRCAQQRAPRTVCRFCLRSQSLRTVLVGVSLGRWGLTLFQHNVSITKIYTYTISLTGMTAVQKIASDYILPLILLTLLGGRSPLPHRGLEGVQERLFICEIPHCSLARVAK